MPTTDVDKVRAQQQRWREKNRALKNARARAAYAVMPAEKKNARRARVRMGESERARKGGHGRRYPAPRNVREWLRHLARDWSPIDSHRGRRREAYQQAMAAHEAWIEQLDVRRWPDVQWPIEEIGR